jgi:hypothetical protein
MATWLAWPHGENRINSAFMVNRTDGWRLEADASMGDTVGWSWGCENRKEWEFLIATRGGGFASSTVNWRAVC